MKLTPEQSEYIETEYLERLISCLEDNDVDDEEYIKLVKDTDKSTTESFVKLFKNINDSLKNEYKITEMFVSDEVFNNLLERLQEV